MILSFFASLRCDSDLCGMFFRYISALSFNSVSAKGLRGKSGYIINLKRAWTWACCWLSAQVSRVASLRGPVCHTFLCGLFLSQEGSGSRWKRKEKAVKARKRRDRKEASKHGGGREWSGVNSRCFFSPFPLPSISFLHSRGKTKGKERKNSLALSLLPIACAAISPSQLTQPASWHRGSRQANASFLLA